jgi:hypothetical protein
LARGDDLFSMRLGPNPLVLWLKHRELDAHSTKRLAEIAVETGNTLPSSPAAKLPGDTRALRGLPVVGARGVGGTMPGTQPERECERRDQQRLKLRARTADA